MQRSKWFLFTASLALVGTAHATGAVVRDHRKGGGGGGGGGVVVRDHRGGGGAIIRDHRGGGGGGGTYRPPIVTKPPISKPPVIVGIARPPVKPPVIVGIARPPVKPPVIVGIARPPVRPPVIGIIRPPVKPPIIVGIARPPVKPPVIGIIRPPVKPPVIVGIIKPPVKPPVIVGIIKPPHKPPIIVGIIKPPHRPPHQPHRPHYPHFPWPCPPIVSQPTWVTPPVNYVPISVAQEPLPVVPNTVEAYDLSCRLAENTAAQDLLGVDAVLTRNGDDEFQVRGTVYNADESKATLATLAQGTFADRVDLQMQGGDQIFLEAVADTELQGYLRGKITLEGKSDNEGLLCTLVPHKY